MTRDLVLAVLAGAAFGGVAALKLRPLLERWVGPTAVWQWAPIAVAAVLLGLATAAGCYFPARAAGRTDPAALLRQG
jgi:ABC-type antimicrobial peptide transport system permease subunit